MSANVVERAHIDYLISAGLWTGRPHVLRWLVSTTAHPQELTRDTADRVGRMLWEQNHRSVSERYSGMQLVPEYEYSSDTEYAEVLGRFEDGWRWRRVMLEPVSALKALACYEYQSCETPDWEQTEAYAYCAALRRALIRVLPGYDAAPWTVYDAEDMAPGPNEPSVEVPAE